MEFLIREIRDRGLTKVFVEHNEVSLCFEMTTYRSSKINDANTVFSSINMFIAQLSKDKQDRLFNIFVDVYNTLEDVNNFIILQNAMRKYVTEIYEIITFEDLKKWCLLYYQLNTPVDIKNSSDGIENQLVKDLTYIRDEYYDLLVMSILLKPMVPLFGYYIDRVWKHVGTRFKEMQAFSLLSDSRIIHLAPFKRLRVYVKAKVENMEQIGKGAVRKNSVNMNGLSLEELPDWLMGKLLVRMILIFEENSTQSIIANTFHVLGQYISGLDKDFGGAVSNRELYLDNDEDGMSIAELCKVKQRIPDGDVCIIKTYMENPYNVALNIYPTYSRDRLKLCLDNMATNIGIPISQHQIVLTQWFLSSAISAKGALLLSRKELMSGMAIVQSLLFDWGMIDLGLIMCASPIKNVSDFSVTTEPQRLNKVYIDKLAEICPYRQTTNTSTVRNSNMVVKAIDMLTSELIKNHWEIKISKGMLNDLEIEVDKAEFIIPGEIRYNLADLVLKLYELDL